MKTFLPSTTPSRDMANCQSLKSGNKKHDPATMVNWSRLQLSSLRFAAVYNR